MAVAEKRRRTRVSKADIQEARMRLLDEAKGGKASGRKSVSTEPRYAKDFWHGLVYCDSYGWAWIADEKLEPACLGKTDEIIPFLKSQRINGENVLAALQTVKQFWWDKDSQSYHLATKNNAVDIPIPPAKSNRITFQKDPHFLRLLDKLMKKGHGIPTIQSELRHKGYDIPYATLGRWVRKRRVLETQGDEP